jgi:hypothetical protein
MPFGGGFRGFRSGLANRRAHRPPLLFGLLFVRLRLVLVGLVRLLVRFFGRLFWWLFCRRNTRRPCGRNGT